MTDTIDIMIITQRSVSEMGKSMTNLAQYIDAKDFVCAGIEWGKIVGTSRSLAEMEWLMRGVLDAKSAESTPE